MAAKLPPIIFGDCMEKEVWVFIEMEEPRDDVEMVDLTEECSKPEAFPQLFDF